MDDISLLPPENTPRRRQLLSPLSLRQSFPTLPSQSTSTPTNPPTPRVTHSPEILSPRPRRHLIESSTSQLWLRTPPLSPVSSRATSPQSAFSSSSPITSFRQLGHARSFSSLLEHEAAAARSLPPHSSSLLRATLERDKEEPSLGRRWVRWMHKQDARLWAVVGAVLAATLLKLCIGLGGYSGRGTPPMFGDYEAQRHWMELTVHLPIRQWYTYDLQYWGLDYPPLTAYISWLCGIIAHWIEPSWVALNTSRGIDTEGSKVFMRTSVLALDTLIYVPALWLFTRTWQGTRSKRTQNLALLTLLFQPALLLVDHGHFQYNSVMLGLTIFSISFFATGQDLLGAICFVLSLGFKQMALYYSPAIGSYLLAKCIYLGPSKGGELFVRLAGVTVFTFLLLFLPFLPPFASFTAILDPITRIFPFARGLFEDKVANFWCASNVVFKWRSWASRSLLLKLSTSLTALGFLPGVVLLIQAGIKHRVSPNTQSYPGIRHKIPTPFLSLLPYALLMSSMSFFLFSFQVHEKSILLPLMPITLLSSCASIGSDLFEWGALVNNIAVFSMWPLLKRDEQGLAYVATLVLWNRLIGYNPFRFPPTSFVQLLALTTCSSAVALHVIEWVVTPPARYPDLFSVLNVLISTPVFGMAWLWSIKCTIEVSWAVGGIGGSSSHSSGRSGASTGTAVGDSVRMRARSEIRDLKADGEVDSVTGAGAAAGFRREGGARAVSVGLGGSIGKRKKGREVMTDAGADDLLAKLKTK